LKRSQDASCMVFPSSRLVFSSFSSTKLTISQRGFTNPPPKTDSAREAVKSFYCELCTRGYARAPDYEAHLSSYDHSHKQRLKDMRTLSKDPAAGTKARKEEKRERERSGLISIKLGGGGSAEAAGGGGEKKGGFKKSGFKSAFTPAEGLQAEDEVLNDEPIKVADKKVLDEDLGVESDTEDEGYEVYDPRFPTD